MYTKHSHLGFVLVVAAIAMFVLASVSQANVISVTTVTGLDATMGISPTTTYTHKLDFPGDGAGATINGVAFSAVGTGSGTDPLTGNPYSLTVPNANNNGSGSSDLLADIIWENPGVSPITLTLGGLTVGTTYNTRFYWKGWDQTDARTGTLAVDTDGNPGAEWSGTINENPFGTTNNRAYWSIKFKADCPTLTLTITPTYTFDTILLYGVSNQLVPEPSALALLVTGLVGLLCYAWRKRR